MIFQENLLLFLILTTTKHYTVRRYSLTLLPSSWVPDICVQVFNDNYGSLILHTKMININIFHQSLPKEADENYPKNNDQKLMKKLKNINLESSNPSIKRPIDETKNIEYVHNNNIEFSTTEYDPGYMQNKRLIGGKLANINTFPFQVQVEIDGKLVCGGVIISRWIILSAAHCFSKEGLQKSVVHVRAGTSKRGGKDGVLVKVVKVEQHESFGHNINPLDYDISILWIEKPLPFTKSIRPIQIAKPITDKLMELFIFYVPGWGVEKEGSQNFTDYLKFIEIHFYNWTECNLLYEGILTERMLCAGNLKVDACQGDSGGGLVHNNTLYGIVSWGLGCGRQHFPGLYTNVIKFRNWIHSKTGLLNGDDIQ